MIYNAFGVVNHSPLEVSEALKALKMSHSIVGGLHARLDIDGLSKEQPVWPVVTNLKTVTHYVPHHSPVLLFISGSRAQLALTNVNRELWNCNDLIQGLKTVLITHGRIPPRTPLSWKLQIKAVTVADYVSEAVNPTFLSDVQSELYKITYALRREVQPLVFDFFYGRLKWSKLRQKLNTSWKLEKLKAVMERPEATGLREAIAHVRSGIPMAKIIQESGFAEFELLYVLRSVEKRLAA